MAENLVPHRRRLRECTVSVIYLSGTLELPVIVGNVSVAAVIVAEGGLSPATIFLLATGLKRIAAGADVLAALGIRATRPVVVSPVIVLVTISILAPIAILVAISILVTVILAMIPVVTIPIPTLVRSSVSFTLKVSVDVLDFPAAVLKISKFCRLPCTAAIVAGGI